MSTSQSTSQATAQTTTPATTTAAPATATSNSATQSAAGLSQEVPPTTTEGGTSGALAALGELSSVVLDAMPWDLAFSTAAANLNLAAVDAWVKAQAVKDLLTCEESTIHAILSTVFPDGWFVELTGEAAGMLGFVLDGNSAAELGGTVSLTGEGLAVDYHGTLNAGPGAALPAGISVTGADEQRAGFWAELGASVGVGVSATWNIDFSEAYQAGEAAVLGALSGEATAYDLIAPAFEVASWSVPEAMTVTTELSGELTAGVTNGLGEEAATAEDSGAASSLFPTGLSDYFRTGLSGTISDGISLRTGIEGEEALVSVAGRVDDEGSALALGYGGSGNVGGDITLTARGPLPDPAAMPDAATWASTLVDVELELGATTGDDRDAEIRTFDNVLDALAAIAAYVAGSGDADLTIGDLVLSREHMLTQAAGIQDLLPFAIDDLTGSSNNLLVTAEILANTVIEVEVPEDMLRVSGLLADVDNEEDARDVQRSVAQQMFGELAEDGTFDVNSPPALIRKAEVTVKAEVEAKTEAAQGNNGVGGGVTGAVGRTVDLVDHTELPVEDLRRLLSA